VLCGNPPRGGVQRVMTSPDATSAGRRESKGGHLDDDQGEAISMTEPLHVAVALDGAG